MTLKIESAASTGGQGNDMKYITFPWPPVVAALSIFKDFSYFHVAYDPMISERNHPAPSIICVIFSVQ